MNQPENINIYKKNSKKKYIIISLVIIFVLGGVSGFWFLKDTIFKTNYVVDEKIYSVKEIKEILDKNPEFLKNRKIKLRASGTGLTLGMGCSYYMNMVDPEDQKLFEEPYTGNKTQAERDVIYEKIRDKPSITADPSSKNISSGKHTLYEGHFYDKWWTKNCKPNGWAVFVRDKALD